MKDKIIWGVIFVFCATLVVSCGKEREDDFVPGISGKNFFTVNVPEMNNDKGTKAHFSNQSFLSLIYDNNDIVRINNVPFTLVNQGGTWYAQGSAEDMTSATNDSLLGDVFYCMYNKIPSSQNTYGSGYYDMNFHGNSRQSVRKWNEMIDGKNCTVTETHTMYNSGIVIAGRTTDTVISMYPSFAVIRIFTEYEYDTIALGFDDNKVLLSGKLLPQEGSMPTVSNTSYLEGVKRIGPGTSGPSAKKVTIKGDLLVANRDDVSGSGEYRYHVYVPLASDGISTTLYLWIKDGSDIYTRKTSISLNRGSVYTLNIDE